MIDSKQVRKELAEACCSAVAAYACSIRGANILGPHTKVHIVPGTNIVQLHVSQPMGDPRFFEVRVKEAF